MLLGVVYVLGVAGIVEEHRQPAIPRAERREARCPTPSRPCRTLGS
jgi:hypothetical protein